MNRVLSIVIVVLALGLAIIPAFSDCLSQGRSLTLQNGSTVPMKCHWTGIAEIGAAVTLGAAGILSFRNRRPEAARSLGLIGVAGGVMAILFPTLLIGVCSNPMMTCNMIMRPALILLGTLGIAASAGMFITANRMEMATA
jgi:hypothetical protein